MKSYYEGPIGTHQRSFERYHPRPSVACSSRNPHPKLQSLFSHERVKLQTSYLARTFTGSIWTKSPLNILEKREHGRHQGLPTSYEFLLSQERVKLPTSNFVRTFIGTIGTKVHYKFGKSSRGHLRDSKIFRAPMYRAHRAVVFAIAQLSCYILFHATIGQICCEALAVMYC